MFEEMMARIARRARARAQARSRDLAAPLAGAGIAAEVEEQGVLLSGKGLRRRIALDARLRATISGAVR